MLGKPGRAGLPRGPAGGPSAPPSRAALAGSRSPLSCPPAGPPSPLPGQGGDRSSFLQTFVCQRDDPEALGSAALELAGKAGGHWGRGRQSHPGRSKQGPHPHAIVRKTPCPSQDQGQALNPLHHSLWTLTQIRGPTKKAPPRRHSDPPELRAPSPPQLPGWSRASE